MTKPLRMIPAAGALLPASAAGRPATAPRPSAKPALPCSARAPGSPCRRAYGTLRVVGERGGAVTAPRGHGARRPGGGGPCLARLRRAAARPLHRGHGPGSVRPGRPGPTARWLLDALLAGPAGPRDPAVRGGAHRAHDPGPLPRLRGVAGVRRVPVERGRHGRHEWPVSLAGRGQAPSERAAVAPPCRGRHRAQGTSAQSSSSGPAVGRSLCPSPLSSAVNWAPVSSARLDSHSQMRKTTAPARDP